MRAAKELIHALQHPHPATPFDIGHEQLQALSTLANIFEQALPQPQRANDESAPRVETPRHDVPPRVEPLSPPEEPRKDYNTDSNRHRHQYNTRSQPKATVAAAVTAPMTAAPPNDTWIPMVNAVIHPVTGKSMEYRELITDPLTKKAWTKSSANEFGRLAQGVGKRIKGTNTIRFIPVTDIPKGRTITYARFVCDVRPQKSEPNRTRITVGGNLIDYPHDVSTKTAELTTSKILWNSTLSTRDARYMTGDVKNFYLNTPLDRPEYMRIALALIPDEIIEEYNLRAIAHNGYVYMEINKGMYGLPQAGMLAHKLLAKRLATKGYFETIHTPGLWTHAFRPIQFTLVVDDFGVKYVGKEHADHLMAALEESYEVSKDWEGTLYCGVTLKWDYDKRILDTSMPGYIAAALHKFQHPMPTRPQDSPHACKPIQYGLKVHMTDEPDVSPRLSPAGVKRIQAIVGTLLWYARAVDPTLRVALSAIAAQQSKATEKTMEATKQLLDYCATHPDAIIRYLASDMQLIVHSDSSYLNEPDARSRAGGHYYLGNKPPKPDINNGPILTLTTVLGVVLSSAAEAEVGALFVTAKEAAGIRTTLAELGHEQPPTPILVDNTTAHGFANETIKQQRSKAMDMRFYWIQDRVRQGQFRVYWAPSESNKADYFTKHFTAPHHRRVRPTYLYTTTSHAAASILRGCVETPVASPSSELDPFDSGFHDSDRTLTPEWTTRSNGYLTVYQIATQ